MALINNQFPFPTFIYQPCVIKYIVFLKSNIKSMIFIKFHEILKTAYGVSSLCPLGPGIQEN